MNFRWMCLHRNDEELSVGIFLHFECALLTWCHSFCCYREFIKHEICNKQTFSSTFHSFSCYICETFFYSKLFSSWILWVNLLMSALLSHPRWSTCQFWDGIIFCVMRKYFFTIIKFSTRISLSYQKMYCKVFIF